MTYLSDQPPANGFDDSEIAGEVARLRVRLAKTEEPVGTLIDTIYSARSIKISLREISPLVGITENTLRKRYPEITKADELREISKNELSLEILVVIADAGEPLASAEIARRLSVHPSEVFSDVVGSLWEAGLCQTGQIANGDVMVSATNDTFVHLRTFLNRYFLRKNDSYLVVLDIGSLTIESVKLGVTKALSAPWSTYVIGPETVRLKQDSNGELLLPIAAPSVATSIEIATRLWASIVAHLDVDPAPDVQIRDVISPGGSIRIESEVLDRFVDRIWLDEQADHSESVGFRWIYHGGVTEKSMAGRCLKSAARALRRAAGNQGEPPEMTNGDAAFNEYVIARALVLTGPLEKIQKPTVEALNLAAETLGPFPGGRLGSFKSPMEEPVTIEEVEATAEDLERIATLAGEAVGHAVDQGVITVREAVKPVVVG